jgi:hypothetical protein
MIPGVQPKLLLNLDTEEPKYRLIRERDKLVKESARVLWLEWNEDGTFKDNFEEPAVGRSLIMSPFNDSLYLADHYYYGNYRAERRIILSLEQKIAIMNYLNYRK